MQHNRMKDIPLDERPYDKCLNYGAQALTDAELLAIFIRTGTKEQNSIELARDILKYFSTQGLLGLMHTSVSELTHMKGIGKVKAVQLVCAAELSKRIARTRARQLPVMTSPAAVAEYYMEQLRHSPVEQVWLSLFDTKNHLIGTHMISQGTVNLSIVSPREVFITALKQGAVTIILVHNHPSGDASPSNEDIAITRKIYEAGKFIGISLLDHIIIGNNCYISLKEYGIL